MGTANAARPTYVGIGAQKCASTWLHRVLEEHPAVSVPNEKEINFFSYWYDRGYEWYEQHFAGAGSAMAIGEISPSYFCEPAVPERLARYMPEARILLSLREPVERALSNHRHEVRTGHLTGEDLSFERGLKNNPMYIEQGLYAKHLANWLRHFSREQIFVVLMEDIEADPVAVCHSVYRFVGVDEHFDPTGSHNRFNRSYASRSAVLTRAKNTVYRATRAPGLHWVWDAASGMGLKKLYRGINQVPSNVVIPQAREETLLQLKQVFAPEIKALESMIGRSLAVWLDR